MTIHIITRSIFKSSIFKNIFFSSFNACETVRSKFVIDTQYYLCSRCSIWNLSIIAALSTVLFSLVRYNEQLYLFWLIVHSYIFQVSWCCIWTHVFRWMCTTNISNLCFLFVLKLYKVADRFSITFLRSEANSWFKKFLEK